MQVHSFTREAKKSHGAACTRGFTHLRMQSGEEDQEVIPRGAQPVKLKQ